MSSAEINLSITESISARHLAIRLIKAHKKFISVRLLPFYIAYKDYLMNKSLIAVGLLAGVMSASVFADDGRINFTAPSPIAPVP